MVKVGAKVLCRFEKISALEVVTGKVNVGSLPTNKVGQVQGSEVEKFHFPEGANSSAQYVAVGTFATFMRQGGHLWEFVCRYKTRKSLLRLPSPGSISTRVA